MDNAGGAELASAELASAELASAELAAAAAPPDVVVLQSTAIVDHICSVSAERLAELVGGEVGGSRRVDLQELTATLCRLGEFTSKAGGSAANTARGLASGFGVRAALVAARGADEWGALFAGSMRRAGVDTQHLVVQPGATGRSLILTSSGGRTMRTCMAADVYVRPDSITPAHFAGARWAVLSGYSFYRGDQLERAAAAARAAGARSRLTSPPSRSSPPSGRKSWRCWTPECLTSCLEMRRRHWR